MDEAEKTRPTSNPLVTKGADVQWSGGSREDIRVLSKADICRLETARQADITG